MDTLLLPARNGDDTGSMRSGRKGFAFAPGCPMNQESLQAFRAIQSYTEPEEMERETELCGGSTTLGQISSIDDLWKTLIDEGRNNMDVEGFMNMYASCCTTGLDNFMPNGKAFPSMSMVAELCENILHDVNDELEELCHDVQIFRDLVYDHTKCRGKVIKITHFRKLIDCLVYLTGMEQTFLICQIVFAARGRFEIPDVLLSRIMVHFEVASQHARVTVEDKHRTFMTRRDFMQMCITIHVLDTCGQTGINYQDLYDLFTDTCGHMSSHLTERHRRGVGARSALKANRKLNSAVGTFPGVNTDTVIGRDPVCILLEVLFYMLPDTVGLGCKAFESPLEICTRFLKIKDAGDEEEKPHIRKKPAGAPSTPSSKPKGEKLPPISLNNKNLSVPSPSNDRAPSRGASRGGSRGADRAPSRGNTDKTKDTLPSLKGKKGKKDDSRSKKPRNANEELKDGLRQRFKTLDNNGDGVLDREEFGLLLRKGDPTMTQKELEVLFESADLNNDGSLQFEEFLSFLFPQ